MKEAVKTIVHLVAHFAAEIGLHRIYSNTWHLEASKVVKYASISYLNLCIFEPYPTFIIVSFVIVAAFVIYELKCEADMPQKTEDAEEIPLLVEAVDQNQKISVEPVDQNQKISVEPVDQNQKISVEAGDQNQQLNQWAKYLQAFKSYIHTPIGRALFHIIVEFFANFLVSWNFSVSAFAAIACYILGLFWVYFKSALHFKIFVFVVNIIHLFCVNYLF